MRKKLRGPGSRVQSSGAALLVLLTAACASSTEGIAPVSYTDPSGICPVGRTGWKLEVLDRRAERKTSEDVVALIGESIRRSFPGCRWDTEAGADAGVVRIVGKSCSHSQFRMPGFSTGAAAANPRPLRGTR